ncbi:MAG: DUF4091 domain-containing protein [Phycisphaerae bacterium]|jgi:hypothetical protein
MLKMLKKFSKNQIELSYVLAIGIVSISVLVHSSFKSGSLETPKVSKAVQPSVSAETGKVVSSGFDRIADSYNNSSNSDLEGTIRNFNPAEYAAMKYENKGSLGESGSDTVGEYLGRTYSSTNAGQPANSGTGGESVFSSTGLGIMGSDAADENPEQAEDAAAPGTDTASNPIPDTSGTDTASDPIPDTSGADTASDPLPDTSGGGGYGGIQSIPKAYYVVVVPSYERVLQDELLKSGDPCAVVFCAKNETESFQIIISNKGNTSLESIDLEMDNWHFAGTPGVGSPEMTLYCEHYVEITTLSYRSEGKKGWYPDALIPFVDPYTGHAITSAKYLARNQDVKPHNSQGYWIDVYVDKNVKAGIYTNEIKVLADRKIIQQIPVTVHVWDFELPKKPALKSYFGRIFGLGNYHGMKSTDAGYETIRNRYVAIVRDHRITVGYYIDPTVNGQTGAVNFSPSFVSELKAYVDEMKPTVVCLGIYGESSFNGSSYVYLSNNLVVRTRYLADWQDFLNNNKWVVNPIIFYDEPRTIQAYNQIIGYGTLIHKYAPNIKFLVTEQIEPRNAGFPSLVGSVDIWCPVWYLGNPVSIKSELQNGNEAWSYGTTAPSPKNPVWLIDYPLVEYRIPAWFSMSMGLEGLLYWQTLLWAKGGLDPWTTSEIYKSSSWIYNGEGYLIYPGAAAGIDGPVSSMRLKVLRDGMEDYDYLWLLNQKTPAGEGTKIATGVAKSFTEFSRDPDEYLQARENVAQQIISLK